MRGLSLFQKALLAIALILLPIFMTFFYGYNKSKGLIEERLLAEMTVIADAYEGQSYQFIEAGKRRVLDFASDGYIRERLEDINSGRGTAGAVALLNEHLVKNKITLDRTIQRINVISLDGRVLASSDPSKIGKDVSGEDLFVKAVASNAVVECVVGGGGGPEVVFSAPVIGGKDGEPVGVIANCVALSELNKIMSGEYAKELGALSWNEGRPKSMEIYIVNKEGVVITESAFVNDPAMNRTVDTMPVRECLDANKEVAGFYTNYKGVAVAGVSTCMPGPKWTLLVEVDRDEVMAPVYILRSSAIKAAVIVGGLIGLLFFVFIKIVVRPLGRLAIAAGDIAGGTYDVDIPIRGSDEIGALGEAFNTMAFDVRKRTEALLESRSSLADAQHIGRIGSWDRDMVNNTLFWSDETYRIFGLTPQGFGATYEAFLDTVHPEDRAFVEESLNEAVCHGKPYDIDHRIRTPDGAEKIVHEKGTVHFDGDGSPVRVVGTVQDITERLLAVKAIVESEKKYRTLFEESKDAIIISSPEGKLLNINPVGIELFGYSSSEELLTVNIAEYLCSSPADRTRFSRALEENGSVNDFEVVGKKRDGEPVVLSITASAVSGHDGKAVAYRGIVRDITEHKKLQQQLIQAQKMEAVGQLTGGIAHDFNNILTAIIGYGKLALMKIDKDDPVRTNIEEMLFSSDRAASLTQGLLAFSRKQIMDMKPVNIIEVVNNFEKLLSMIIGENIEIKTSFKKRNLMVIADSAQVEQVLMNLATNARDAMSGEGTLSISTDAVEIDTDFIRTHGYGEPGDYACIVVADTGAGMDEETRKRIFEPFFTTKGVGEGTGLGLSIIYGIIKQHNGYINVDSAPGGGTTFRIYLPVTKQVEEMPASAAALAPLAGRETVLLAEDDVEVRRLTKTVLEEFGYTVIEASNGEDAVSRFEENSDEVQLIILDMIMPGKTGKEAYDEMIKIKPDTRVLFTSGYTKYVVGNKGLFEDGLDIIMKPNTPAELLRKIREVLDR